MSDLNINPISNTATACLGLFQTTDIPYAKEWAEIHEIEKKTVDMLPGSDSIQLNRLALTVMLEARLKSAESLIRREGNPNLLDLACGFTPRSFYMAKEGVHYVGADLPYVIEQVKPAMTTLLQKHEELQECQSRIRYEIVDATDYSQLEAAVSHLSGPITVTCEGLMGYMPACEQREVATNIHRLLSAHGGVWITPDYNGSFTGTSLFVANYIFSGVTEKTVPQSAWLDKEHACEMFKELGFSVSEYVCRPNIETLSSLRFASGEEKDELYHANQAWHFMLMRCNNA
ncbi:MAG: class I SAM-dependent methyltransferase [Clostridia bacterium]